MIVARPYFPFAHAKGKKYGLAARLSLCILLVYCTCNTYSNTFICVVSLLLLKLFDIRWCCFGLECLPPQVRQVDHRYDMAELGGTQ